MANKNISPKKAERSTYLAGPNYTSNTVLENEIYYNMPTSSGTDLVMKALGTGSNLASLPDTTKQVSNSHKIEIRESHNKRQIISKGENTETTIEIGDIEKLVGSNKAAKKMFALALIKINEQAYDHNTGRVYKDRVTFPLQELVDLGYYSSLRAARRGYIQAMDTLTSIKVKSKVKRGKNTYTTELTEEAGEGIRVMFTGGVSPVRGQCIMEINDKINWYPLFQYFTVLPKWAFGLGNRPFDLINTIFYLARQNTKLIKDRGYFTISFRAIQQRLDLPDENKTLNPSRDIRQPIEDAVKDIEDAQQAAGQEGINLELIYDANANIKNILDNGYLKVSLSGYYAEPFIENSTKQEKAIEHNIKRKEAIEDRARTQALQKNIETELKDNKPQ